MKKLAQHLKQAIASLYVLCGDEYLLVREAKELIVAAAKRKGFASPEQIIVDNTVTTERLAFSIKNRSLFDEKRILEIDHSMKKPSKETLQLLTQHAETTQSDITIIFKIGKLTREQQNTQWFKALATHCIVVTIWPMTPQELPQWITTRLQQLQLSADFESIKLLADMTEGNLLATQQALEKLKLLYPNESISTTQMMSVLTDNARFNIFDLTNQALQGRIQSVMRILAHLKQEGIEPLLILWSLTREIRHLMELVQKIQHGSPMEQVLRSEWQLRKPLVKSALSRHTMQSLARLLTTASEIDQMIKGIAQGNIWDRLGQLTLGLSLR